MYAQTLFEILKFYNRNHQYLESLVSVLYLIGYISSCRPLMGYVSPKSKSANIKKQVEEDPCWIIVDETTLVLKEEKHERHA